MSDELPEGPSDELVDEVPDDLVEEPAVSELSDPDPDAVSALEDPDVCGSVLDVVSEPVPELDDVAVVAVAAVAPGISLATTKPTTPARAAAATATVVVARRTRRRAWSRRRCNSTVW